MFGRRVHRSGTLLLSVLMVAIGVALVVEAIAGRGAISVLLVAGVLFVAAGVGRLYIELKRGSGA
jgi:hypothetical protein